MRVDFCQGFWQVSAAIGAHVNNLSQDQPVKASTNQEFRSASASRPPLPSARPFVRGLTKKNRGFAPPQNQ
jgi:hypothetical protein